MTEKAEWEKSRDLALREIEDAEELHNAGAPGPVLMAQFAAIACVGDLLVALMEQNRAHHAELLEAIDEVL